MIKLVFSVFDSKVEAYLEPMYYLTEAEAERAFRNACIQQEHPFCHNAEDYTLFQLGDFDDNTGMLAPFTTPKPVIKAIVAKIEGSMTNGE